MKEGKIIRLLVLLIAVVVMIESIVLVSNLDKGTMEIGDITPVEEIEEVKEPVADFIFETESKEMEVGKDYEVNLTLVGIEKVDLDAMEIYVKYDSEKLAISKLTTSDELPEPVNSEIDGKSGLVSSVFLWDTGETYSIFPDQIARVLSFVVTPKVEGEMEIALSDADANEEFSVLLVESVTSNQLLFLSNKLEISVVN